MAGSVWVSWPLKGTAIALVMLIGSRKHLFKNNLFDTVDKWDKVSCTAESREARTITGICYILRFIFTLFQPREHLFSTTSFRFGI